jgi:type I site-specific restriction-modification system R (restriction) subunit
LRYSNDESQRSLDMVIFINGLPVMTFELKNSLKGGKPALQPSTKSASRSDNPRQTWRRAGSSKCKEGVFASFKW